VWWRCAHHEGVPAHGGAQALEGVGGAELGDDPIVAVPLDDGPIEVEHHHDVCGSGGHRRLATASRFSGDTPLSFWFYIARWAAGLGERARLPLVL
jgi:hypothetical protein